MSSPGGGDESPVVYLTFDEALLFHAVAMGMRAGSAVDHLRNRGGLAGALARPETHAVYADADLAMQAAVLAHGIAETQPFLDGNKRTAVSCMVAFLRVNGCRLVVEPAALAQWILDLADGLTPEDFAERLRAHLEAT